MLGPAAGWGKANWLATCASFKSASSGLISWRETANSMAGDDGCGAAWDSACIGECFGLGFLKGILSNRILMGFLSSKGRRAPPRRNLIQRSKRKPAQSANHSAVRAYSMRREQRARRLVNKGHEFVWESRHGTADADAADIGTATYPIHPSPFADIALHHWPPAAQLHNACRRSVFFGKVGLLVIAAAVTTLVQRLGKEPRGTKRAVNRNRSCRTGCLAKQIQQDLHHVVRLHWASGHTNNGDARRGFPGLPKVFRQAHTACGIAFNGVNAAISSARSRRNNCPRMGSKPVNPIARWNGLAGGRIRAQASPKSFRLVAFIRNGAFDDKNERTELAVSGETEAAQEIIAHLVGENRVVQPDARDTRNTAPENVFNTGLGGRSHGDGVAVAPERGGNPKDIDFCDRFSHNRSPRAGCGLKRS